MRTRSSKGWGQLPREIARALAGAKLNGSEWRIVWVIIYKTIAFNKVEDLIPRIQFVELTEIADRHLDFIFNSLLKKGVIFRKDNVYGIQTDFSKWEIPPKQVVIQEIPPNQGRIPPNQGRIPPKQVDSRDPSQERLSRKGLSTSEKKKKREADKRGLKMIKEVLSKGPGSKLRWK